MVGFFLSRATDRLASVGAYEYCTSSFPGADVATREAHSVSQRVVEPKPNVHHRLRSVDFKKSHRIQLTTGGRAGDRPRKKPPNGGFFF